jgi:hypothetical protein
MACVIRGGRIYVCELLRHEEYERVLPERRANQYALNKFRRWVRPPDAPEPPATEEQAYRALRDRYDHVLLSLKETESDSERLLRESVAASVRMTVAEQSLAEERSVAGRLRSQVVDLETQAQTLRGELALARRPWWKAWYRRH